MTLNDALDDAQLPNDPGFDAHAESRVRQRLFAGAQRDVFLARNEFVDSARLGRAG